MLAWWNQSAYAVTLASNASNLDARSQIQTATGPCTAVPVWITYTSLYTCMINVFFEMLNSNIVGYKVGSWKFRGSKHHSLETSSIGKPSSFVLWLFAICTVWIRSCRRQYFEGISLLHWLPIHSGQVLFLAMETFSVNLKVPVCLKSTHVELHSRQKKLLENYWMFFLEGSGSPSTHLWMGTPTG